MNKELNAAEAVYGFVGWLTSREERTVMSAKDDCAPIAELIKRFCTENNLPEVSDQWPLNLIHPSGEVAVPNAIYPCKPDIFEATYAPETKLQQQGKCLYQIDEPQAKALQLAHALGGGKLIDDSTAWADTLHAADAELRRQHARIEELEDVADMAIKRIDELEAHLLAATQPAAQGMNAPNEWEDIRTLPTCDDLIWLYCQDSNTIDGPIAPEPNLEEYGWSHWAYANAPSTVWIDAAQAKQGGV